VLANLKAALAARKLRQIDLALQVGIDPSALSQIVNGWRTADPTLRHRIARVLRADEPWLFSSKAHIPAPSMGGNPRDVQRG
jgi:transcriptional regulator with XRE-family HTH domain